MTKVRPATPAATRTVERRSGTATYVVVIGVLLAILLASLVAGVAVGSIAIAPKDVVTSVLHELAPAWVQPSGPAYVHTVVVDVRGPRVVRGAVTGAGLAMVGMTMQALVRNPLADPYLLGVSSGASVGAVAVLVSGITVVGPFSTPLAAFAGALLSMSVVYSIARAGGRLTTTRLVLAGVAVAYVLSSVTSLMLMLASNADRSREVLTWLLGGLGGSDWSTLPLPSVVVAVGVVVLLTQARSLDLLLAGDEAARTMGLDVNRFRVQMFVVTSLLTGVLVAVSGPIGFVGLILPHAIRMLVGSGHRRALPAAALGGAAFLVVADVVARTIASPQEIPVGILTALCGGPFFLWLIRRDAKRRAGAST